MRSLMMMLMLMLMLILKYLSEYAKNTHLVTYVQARKTAGKALVLDRASALLWFFSCTSYSCHEEWRLYDAKKRFF